ncbi:MULTISPECIES: TetR/AcrR family transcriptional regulator C-terminal domain-containing protein [Microbacterium]|uniref:TetR/AcrR family transcriptional regulator n=1 Tax=Microbacterium TaxID=33882 RepID=UPI000D64A95B|nr:MULTISPECIES: TetR/AcrR family transcriptional regulator C-terminal domain-containing protein [Microbacterium]
MAGRVSKGEAAGSGGKQTPRRLSRELILETALAHIDESGVQSLSMRSLAQDLGVEAMSLYRYVQGKEDLLEGVVTRLMGDLMSNLDIELGEHWQGYLQTTAHEIRRVAIEHPRVFPLVATRHPAAPWLRPPLRSVEVVNAFLTALLGYGFTDQQAVDTYRSFTSFLLGQLLLESATRGAPTGPVDQPIEEGDSSAHKRGGGSAAEGSPPLDDAPEVLRLRDLLSEDRSDEEFEVSLEALLDRLDREITP